MQDSQREDKNEEKDKRVVLDDGYGGLRNGEGFLSYNKSAGVLNANWFQSRSMTSQGRKGRHDVRPTCGHRCKMRRRVSNTGLISLQNRSTAKKEPQNLVNDSKELDPEHAELIQGLFQLRPENVLAETVTSEARPGAALGTIDEWSAKITVRRRSRYDHIDERR